MKQEQERKKRRSVWYVIGGIAFVAGMSIVMPKLIEKASEYFYSKNQPPVKPLDDDDWDPEIVKKEYIGGYGRWRNLIHMKSLKK